MKKRIMIIVISVVCIIVIGIITSVIYTCNLFASMSITFWDDSPTVEYGSNSSIVNTNIKDYKNCELTNITELDTFEIGCPVVTYTLENQRKFGKLTKNVQIQYCVRDTQFPVFEFYEDPWIVKKGETVDLASNIKSVYDPVDGELEYKVEGYYDKRWPADYCITVSAKDKNYGDFEFSNSYTLRVVE